jgi:hypothetical protein
MASVCTLLELISVFSNLLAKAEPHISVEYLYLVVTVGVDTH